MEPDTKKELNKISGQIENLSTFMRKNVALKLDLKEMEDRLPSKEDFNKLVTSVDSYAKQSKDYYQEVTVLVAKVSRMETWIKVAATKLGVEYKV